MKKIIYIYAIILITAIGASCEDAKTPHAEYLNIPAVGQISEVNELEAAANIAEPNQDYISADAFNVSFTDFFKNYIDENGLIDYPRLRRMRLDFTRPLEMLEKLKPEVYEKWAQKGKIAFWINAYNICTLKGIIDHYPIEPSRFMLLIYPANSIMHIKGLRDKTYFSIMGLQYTLDEIERDILLKKFNEPRACFTITYGTQSSPPLRNEPYLGKLLDKQLNDQVKKFLNDAKNFKIDTAENIIYLSAVFKMYDWRQQAFQNIYGKRKLFREYGNPEKAFLNFIQDFISKSNAELLKRRLYSIEYSKYNWALNAQPEKQ